MFGKLYNGVSYDTPFFLRITRGDVSGIIHIVSHNTLIIIYFKIFLEMLILLLMFALVLEFNGLVSFIC